MTPEPTIAESCPAAELAPARRRLALWLIYGILGAHVVAMLGKIDEWPLSYFGMYSRVQSDELTWDVAYGVTADGREIRLQDDDFWEPLGPYRLGYALKRLRQKTGGQAQPPSGDRDKVDRTIAGLLEIYETHRRAGLHEGPPLAKLRLYAVTWRLDPKLGNLDTPLRRELVSEYVARR
jgi:hypothetical protein